MTDTPMAVRERPILCRADTVRGFLANRDVLLVRLVDGDKWNLTAARCCLSEPAHPVWRLMRSECPYGQPGDRLWVRETWRLSPEACEGWSTTGPCTGWVDYRANVAITSDEGSALVTAPSFGAIERITTGHDPEWDWDFMPDTWRPSIHMPRWACRLRREVLHTWVDGVQSITEAEAAAEFPHELGHEYDGQKYPTARAAFAAMWDGYTKRYDKPEAPTSFASNPLAWFIRTVPVDAA